MSESEPRFVMSSRIRKKITEDHGVEEHEIREAFADRGKLLKDRREEHRSDPPTVWIVGQTYAGRDVKVVFILQDGKVIIKSAYPANDDELRIYNKYGR